MGTFKLVLDYAGVEPNPARDRLREHLLLAFDTLEATGIRIGELT